MKNSLAIVLMAFFMVSCNLFENKEKRAIELVQQTKMQLDSNNVITNLIAAYSGIGQSTTWQDFANILAKGDPNAKYNWTAKETDEAGIYVVAFQDEKDWGHTWEVVLEQKTVKHINQSEYLMRKYGLSRLDPDGKFEIKDIKLDTLKVERKPSYNSKEKLKEVVYIMKGSIKNKTGKSLTSASISGKLQVIFKDKVVESSSDWKTGFETKISKTKPWKPDTEKSFYIKATGIEDIYLEYIPEYVFFNVNINAADPIGFTYDKKIHEDDLKAKWEKLK